jgi:hypothetical protein
MCTFTSYVVPGVPPIVQDDATPPEALITAASGCAAEAFEHGDGCVQS